MFKIENFFFFCIAEDLLVESRKFKKTMLLIVALNKTISDIFGCKRESLFLSNRFDKIKFVNFFIQQSLDFYDYNSEVYATITVFKKFNVLLIVQFNYADK